MKDFQVVSALTQLKALVAGLYGRIDSLAVAAAPTVDFAVDMFDRQNQDTLGPYWSGANHVIRANRAITSVGATTAATVAYVSTTFGSAYCAVNVYGSASTLVESVYQANLSSSDFTCQAPFFSPSTEWEIAAATLDPDNFVTVDGVVTSGAATGLASGGGVCIANSSNAVEGFGVVSYRAPALLASRYGVLCSLPAISAAKVLHGSSVLAAVVLSEASKIAASPPSSSCAQYSAAFDIINVGASNNVSVVCNDNLVTMMLGRNVIFSGAPAAVSRKSRVRAGLTTPNANVAAAKVLFPAADAGGITRFKVWRNDIPEPPDESGHGTLVNGRWQYTDKYHTPVVDEDGNIVRNEDGTVASYVYDPEA